MGRSPTADDPRGHVGLLLPVSWTATLVSNGYDPQRIVHPSGSRWACLRRRSNVRRLQNRACDQRGSPIRPRIHR